MIEKCKVIHVNVCFNDFYHHSCDSEDFTCGSPLSPAACSFSFINATLAAVALFFAPLRPLLLDPSFDSELSQEGDTNITKCK